EQHSVLGFRWNRRPVSERSPQFMQPEDRPKKTARAAPARRVRNMSDTSIQSGSNTHKTPASRHERRAPATVFPPHHQTVQSCAGDEGRSNAGQAQKKGPRFQSAGLTESLQFSDFAGRIALAGLFALKPRGNLDLVPEVLQSHIHLAVLEFLFFFDSL